MTLRALLIEISYVFYLFIDYVAKIKKRLTELTLAPSLYSLIVYMNVFLSEDSSGLKSLTLMKNHPVNDVICFFLWMEYSVVSNSEMMVSSLWDDVEFLSAERMYGYVVLSIRITDKLSPYMENVVFSHVKDKGDVGEADREKLTERVLVLVGRLTCCKIELLVKCVTCEARSKSECTGSIHKVRECYSRKVHRVFVFMLIYHRQSILYLFNMYQYPMERVSRIFVVCLSVIRVNRNRIAKLREDELARYKRTQKCVIQELCIDDLELGTRTRLTWIES